MDKCSEFEMEHNLYIDYRSIEKTVIQARAFLDPERFTRPSDFICTFNI